MKHKIASIMAAVIILSMSAQCQGDESPFGSSDVDSSSLKGDIYYLPEGTSALPDFSGLTPVGSIYTKVLDVPERSFTEGFPGVTDRFEWFAIRYTGSFDVDSAGDYAFRLVSDDGSRLFVDGEKIIDNDGIHASQSAPGSVYLSDGLHSIEVDYFQGPREYVALQLFWTPPGGVEEISNPQYIPTGTDGTDTSAGPAGGRILDFRWLGTDEDMVGIWDDGLPDGSDDGHFGLRLSLPASTEVKYMEVYSADAYGNPTGSQIWDSASSEYWVLGVFRQGDQINENHVPSLGVFSGDVELDLYASNSGWFNPGQIFGVDVMLGDGTRLQGLVSIGDEGDRGITDLDLTGIWNCDDEGTYYIQQRGSTVWWYGEEDALDPDWSNAAHGSISDGVVSLEYSDLPKGEADGYGQLVLEVISADELSALEKPESYGGSTWWRADDSAGEPVR